MAIGSWYPLVRHKDSEGTPLYRGDRVAFALDNRALFGTIVGFTEFQVKIESNDVVGIVKRKSENVTKPGRLL